MKAPFPWFGGKSRAASVIWERFGDVKNYVEPFFGSGAVLLARPHKPRIETVNDIDGFVCNAWRSIKMDPEETARWADQPVFENDLHARHVWLKERREELASRLEADPDYHDVKIAGWWLWGLAVWIGSGFCGESRSRPWVVVDGRLVRNGGANGVTRQLVQLGGAGRGVCCQSAELTAWFDALAARLKRVRVCCGDWARVLGPAVTFYHGLSGVLLDPPYDVDGTDYGRSSKGISSAVREWALDNGDNPELRIALCGYVDEGHADLMPESWECAKWRASGGYNNMGDGANRKRERIWFSPACLKAEGPLFARMTG